MLRRVKLLAATAMLCAFCFSSSAATAADAIETAGVAVGVTLGNVFFLPIKAIEVTVGAVSGAFSYLVTGNADLTKQIWRDTTEGPYVITPDVARTSVGERPELLEQK
jgi:ABC-type sugar transport system substrate-binding protein